MKTNNIIKKNKKNNFIQNQKINEKKLIKPKIKEIGGTDGPEPTRYGDWEKNGRCSDF